MNLGLGESNGLVFGRWSVEIRLSPAFVGLIHVGGVALERDQAARFQPSALATDGQPLSITKVSSHGQKQFWDPLDVGCLG